MRTIKLTFLLALAALVAPLLGHAAQPRGGEGGGKAVSVSAILITASHQKSGSDRRLAQYEGILRNNLPYESYKYVGENSASVPAGGKTSLDVQGHRLELQSEGGAVFVRAGRGGASISPGQPGAVFVVGSAEKGDVYAIIVSAR